MEKNRKELALYILNLKIKQQVDNKDYNEIKEKITYLQNEKKEVYANNEAVIEKCLNEYLEEVKFV